MVLGARAHRRSRIAPVFIATALLYPCVLAALCAGAGLLVDRVSGRFLPAPLLLSVGAAALIALSQLSTYASPLAPATPYLMLALALAGIALGRARARSLAHRCLSCPWPAAVSVLVYAIALAPVLLAGRASLSSYMALADSAVHLIGADFLIRHGQDYAHLDLRNSYGQFIHDYYATNYPSGADTLFGGSAFLLGLPLIWAFQPFNAFMLASAAAPAWLLARRMRLDGAWAALAALTAVLPALVYAYELFASVKEITALSMILTLGCLVVAHRRWLLVAPARAVPFALVLGAGVSALGPAFGAWALAAVVVLGVVLALHARASRVAHVAGDGGARRADAADRGVADLAPALRLAPGRPEHCLHEQPRQPAHAAARDPGVRRVAARQLQALPYRRRARRHPCADRARVPRRAARGRADAQHPRVCAARVDRVDAARVAARQPLGHHLGWRQDADAHLARGGAHRMGRGGVAAVPLSPGAVVACRGRTRARAGRRRARVRCAPVPQLRPRAHSSLPGAFLAGLALCRAGPHAVHRLRRILDV